MSTQEHTTDNSEKLVERIVDLGTSYPLEVSSLDAPPAKIAPAKQKASVISIDNVRSKKGLPNQTQEASDEKRTLPTRPPKTPPQSCQVKAKKRSRRSKKKHIGGFTILQTVVLLIIGAGTVWDRVIPFVFPENTHAQFVKQNALPVILNPEKALKTAVDLPPVAPTIPLSKAVAATMEISPVQQAEIKHLVKQVSDCEGKHTNTIHKQLRQQFGYDSYKKMTGFQYEQVVSILKERMCR